MNGSDPVAVVSVAETQLLLPDPLAEPVELLVQVVVVVGVRFAVTCFTAP